MALIPFKKKKPHKTPEGKVGLTLKAHNIDTVIDVGANNGGAYNRFRSGGFTGNVISIEPIPSVQETLSRAAEKDPHWRIMPPMALGDKNSTAEFNIAESSDLSSVLQHSEALETALPRTKIVETITVEMKTLDSVYEELELDGKNVFLKIDTQGYEMPILRHAEKTLEHIKGIQLEMSLFELYEGETLFDETIAFLKERGFSTHMLIETNFSRKLNRQLQVDGIFYKD